MPVFKDIKHSNVKRLKNMAHMWNQEEENDMILLTEFDKFICEMGAISITEK
jgi:hypothetical protein